MTASKSHRSTNPEHLIRWMIFLLLLICYSYFLPRWADWSQNARLDLTLAIVDEKTLSIDNYYQNTGDFAYFEGHYYLDKAPGPSFLAVPVYAAIRPILHLPPVETLLIRLSNSSAFNQTLSEDGTGLLVEKIYFMIVLYVVSIFIGAIPSAILGVCLYNQLSMFHLSRGWKLLLVGLYGIATPAFPYSGAFFSHQLTAFLLFGSFQLIYLMTRNKPQPGGIFLAGVMLGWSIISEYPTALIAGGIGIYFLSIKEFRRHTPWLILGGLIPGILLAIYDWSIFHTILPVGYQYSLNYQEQHSVGIISIGIPRLEALWGITFSSYRGLFFLSPFLLLGIPGFWYWWKSGKHRPVWWLSIWAVLSFILFNSSSIMWQGGYSIGPRYLIPMLPFLMLGLAAFIYRCGDKRWLQFLIGILGVWSFLAIWAETIGGQSFPDWRRNPLFTYSIPNLLQGDIARNLGMILNLDGWASLIPLIVILAGLSGILFWYLKKYPDSIKGETG